MFWLGGKPKVNCFEIRPTVHTQNVRWHCKNMKFKTYIFTIISFISCFHLNGQESQSEKWSRFNVKEVILIDSDSSYQFIDILDSSGNYHISIYKESNFIDSAFHFYFPNGNLKKILSIKYHSEDDSLFIDSTLITFYYNEHGNLQKEEKIESELHKVKVYRYGQDHNKDSIFIYDNLIYPHLGENKTTYSDSLILKTVVIKEYKFDKILFEKSNNLNNQNDYTTSYKYNNQYVIQQTTYFGQLDSDFEIKQYTLKKDDSYGYKNQQLTSISSKTEYSENKEPENMTTKFEYNKFGLLIKESLIKEDSIILEKNYYYSYFK